MKGTRQKDNRDFYVEEIVNLQIRINELDGLAQQIREKWGDEALGPELTHAIEQHVWRQKMKYKEWQITAISNFHDEVEKHGEHQGSEA